MDALFDYLTVTMHRDPQATREALLADYRQSGARASPGALQGLLQQRTMAGKPGVRLLTRRQEQHAAKGF